MRLLLDTHALLWALGDPEQLDAQARQAIVDPENVAAVSAASAWEIAIKRALRKLEAPADLASALAASRFQQVAISVEHALAAGSLPNHHGDPFDRMLIAQARIEGFTVVTRDARFELYGVGVLAA